MLASLFWLSLGATTPAPPPAPAAPPVSPELADPFAAQRSTAARRIPPERVPPPNPPLLSPFAPRYLDLRAPAAPSVRSPFDA